MSALTKKPQQKADYRLEMIDDELLLFHPGQNRIIYCNTTASLVWQLCDGERTGHDIVDLLQIAFPESAETITADVQTTLKNFSQHGAIEFV